MMSDEFKAAKYLGQNDIGKYWEGHKVERITHEIGNVVIFFRSEVGTGWDFRDFRPSDIVELTVNPSLPTEIGTIGLAFIDGVPRTVVRRDTSSRPWLILPSGVAVRDLDLVRFVEQKLVDKEETES